MYQASTTANRASATAKAKRHASRAGTTYALFVRAVANAGAWLPADAQDHLLAVVATLEEVLPFRDVVALEAQLPSRLDERLARVPILDLPPIGRSAFVTRVARRLGVSAVEADPIVSTVFHVLRSRISSGEAEKVGARLSDELRLLWNAH